MKPLLSILLCILCVSAQAVTYTYFSQNGSGSMNGTIANPYPLSTVNGNVSSGTNWWLQGNISGGSSGAIFLQGNNISLTIPSGSCVTTPGSSSSGSVIILAGGLTGITISGGGGIGCTANGSGLTYQNAVWGVLCQGAMSGLVVQNLSVTNIYVHTLLSDNSPGSDVSGGIKAGALIGSNYFGNLYVSNCATGILASGGGTTVYQNSQFYNCNHDLYPDSVTGATVVIGPGNFFGASSNWATTSLAFHNDSIIWGPGGTVTSFTMFGNTFYGPMTPATAYFFNDGASANYFWQWNNLYRTWPGDMFGNGLIIGSGAMANNTIIDDGLNTAVNAGDYTFFTNNLFTNCYNFLIQASGTYHAVAGYNIYAGGTGATPWQIDGTNYSTFASFQSTVEPTAINGVGPLVNPDGTLPTGSTAIGVGQKLSSLFTVDINGNPRPSTSAWDIGAVQHTPGAVIVGAGPGTNGITLRGTNATFPNGITITATPQ